MPPGFPAVVRHRLAYLLALLLFLSVLSPRAAEAQPVQEAILRASSDDVSTDFGEDVALDQGRMVVGVKRDSGPDSEIPAAGAAYVYERQPDGTWLETSILRASNAGPVDQFGSSVDISGDRIVVGAPNEDGAGTTAGAAYVYERQANGSWIETAILRASNAGDGDSFGLSASISGERVVVGAQYEDGPDPLTLTGAAYVFERQSDGTWQETEVLRSSDPDDDEQFGQSVELNGTRLVVSAPEKKSPDDRTWGVGAVYVYERQPNGTWQEKELLRAPDAQSYDRFGGAVSIDDDWLIVGSNARDIQDPRVFAAGAVYVFQRQTDDSWQLTEQLRASNAEEYDRFGSSVTIDGDRLAVGAPLEDGLNNENGAGSNTGAAYIFERHPDDTWKETGVVRGVDPLDYDDFGRSVSIHGDLLAVGQPRDIYSTYADESAYVFNFDPNIEPTVATPLTDQSAIEDDPPIEIDLSGRFTDPETPNADLELSLASNDNETLVDASVNNEQRQLTLTLQPNESGTATITVQAKDEATATATSSFVLTVTEVPDLSITDGSSAGLSLTPNIDPGTDDNLLGLLKLSASTDGVSLEGVTISNSAVGTAGMTGATLYASADPSLDPTTDDELVVLSIDETDAPATFDFSGFTTDLTSTATYLLVAVDVQPDAPDTPIALTLADKSALAFTGGEITSLNGSAATSFNDLPLSVDATSLPVELAGLSAQATETGVTIEWQTLSETGNDRFEIERRILTDAPSVSEDATNSRSASTDWVQVGTVGGAGTTTTAQRYGFDDTSLPYDATTLSYRLKQVDVDGTSAYSSAIQVRRAEATSLKLLGTFPNPAQGQATARLNVPDDVANARLVLYDLLGRQVQALPISSVGRQKVQLRTNDLAPGTYFLRLTGNGQVRTKRLTVVR
ncbi:hypothetical protein CRI94_15500 [Longibacter salinarum]|uniref:Secretion system C-terminal sorting domain-containing protein n=1 Tax=Longibacter salinarum TaxID=1850348 RepID=A0A2A8CUG8_9BACT|nr:T9SS type A sorting domain-containing protein [Longibacter salinarum]PEN11439.1 hypothetical protein CRI94_15500 [Longibacter salinarum]